MSVCGDCQGELCNNTFEANMSIENYINRNIFDIFEQSINTKSSHIFCKRNVIIMFTKKFKAKFAVSVI